MRKSRSSPKLAKLEQAKALLADVLRGGPVEATEVAEVARMSGISEATLRRAKDALSVRSERVGGSWLWALPEGQDYQGAHRGSQEDHQNAHQDTRQVAQDERYTREREEKPMPKPKKRLDEPQIFAYWEAEGGMISNEELRRRKGYHVEERP
jgi:hypothetical protein